MRAIEGDVHNADVRMLQAKQAITEVLHRYCRGIDRADGDLLRSVYWPDAVDNHGTLDGPVDEFIDYVTRKFAADGPYPISHHMVSNTLIELDGDVADTESYFHAAQRRVAGGEPREEIVLGRYLDRFERRNGEWRILRRRCVYDWARVLEIDDAWWSQASPGLVRGSASHADLVYSRPPR